MTKAKQRLLLEVAYDVVAKVHSDICTSTNFIDESRALHLQIFARPIYS